MNKNEKINAAASKLPDSEKAKLRTSAKKELARLDKAFAEKDLKNKIDNLKDKFSECEIIYKLILKEYTKTTKSKNKDDITMSQVPYAHAFAGYTFDYELLDSIFGSKKTKGIMSVKWVRNHLNHNLKQSAINELETRYDEMMQYMNTYLEAIRKG